MLIGFIIGVVVGANIGFITYSIFSVSKRK